MGAECALSVGEDAVEALEHLVLNGTISDVK